MATRTLTADAPGATALEFRAEQATVDVRVEPDLQRAVVELSGPEETIEATRSSTSGSRWTVEIPAPEPTVVAGGGVHVVSGSNVVIGGSNTGAISISGGVVSVGGTTTINGVTVSGGAVEQVRATVRLPADSALRSRITNGEVSVRGHLTEVDHQGHNVELRLDSAIDVVADVHNGTIAIGRATGTVEATTHNGSVRVDATGQRTTAHTHNGGVDITAASDGPISARTHNGSITVRTNGFRPQVRTRTHNGRDRVL